MENTVCFRFCKKKKSQLQTKGKPLNYFPSPQKTQNKSKNKNKKFTVREPHLHNSSKIEYSQYDIKHLLFQIVKNKRHLRPTQGKLVNILNH